MAAFTSKGIVTTGRDYGWRKGDRVRFNGDTGRQLRFVTKEIDGRSVEVSLFIRPSRGFAKHVRKVKARAMEAA